MRYAWIALLCGCSFWTIPTQNRPEQSGNVLQLGRGAVHGATIPHSCALVKQNFFGLFRSPSPPQRVGNFGGLAGGLAVVLGMVRIYHTNMLLSTTIFTFFEKSLLSRFWYSISTSPISALYVESRARYNIIPKISLAVMVGGIGSSGFGKPIVLFFVLGWSEGVANATVGDHSVYKCRPLPRRPQNISLVDIS